MLVRALFLNTETRSTYLCRSFMHVSLCHGVGVCITYITYPAFRLSTHFAISFITFRVLVKIIIPPRLPPHGYRYYLGTQLL